MAVPGSTGRQTGGLRSLLRRPGAARPASPAGRAARDDEIVAELYREYHRPLLSFVLRLTGGDRQWAEDVVQETMIRAWRSADRLDDRTSSLMPWLATVSRRIVIDNRRQREVRPPEVGDGPLENLPMADEMEGLLRKVVVAEALESLSPAHRQALTETVLRDRTVNQAAEYLGIPVGTVKSRVYYALRALRVALEERGVTS
ncbi:MULTISPECIES: sigma-70 family RNA polymerase sigma factor [Actinomadura]|uniref:RNA polymerase sigma factor n=1 Tax=Actinomadura livida TaxID=79909 RepID=A0A7W7IHS2_9ACTN|nr:MULTISPECIES: sigma-70 family RNA polymerase sigma factor [Actinomadura]MBB4777240.1 RNA polymerase sigma-70 factor (ECF subfamily) [Actinomadura catellatispora]TDB85421.1 sigma-70 family RNA polymerase sigma factor [Actinomadura sp. 7K534]GGU20607.1 RNA polymerase sigma factor [Actinomadura livida]